MNFFLEKQIQWNLKQIPFEKFDLVGVNFIELSSIEIFLQSKEKVIAVATFLQSVVQGLPTRCARTPWQCEKFRDENYWRM